MDGLVTIDLSALANADGLDIVFGFVQNHDGFLIVAGADGSQQDVSIHVFDFSFVDQFRIELYTFFDKRFNLLI